MLKRARGKNESDVPGALAKAGRDFARANGRAMSNRRDRDDDAGRRLDADAVPPPLPSEIDTVVDAVSSGLRRTGQRSSTDPDASAPETTTATSQPIHRAPWLHPQTARRLTLTLAAFVVGIAASIWGLRTFQPAPAQVSQRTRVEDTVARRQPSAPAPSPPVAAPQSRRTFVAPAAPIEPPAPPLARPAPLVPRSREARKVPSFAPARAAPALPAIATPAAPLTETVTLARATPRAPAVAPVGRLSEAPTTVPDADAVRQTLDHYVDAYKDLDVVAAAAVWPSVDRRALSRAFATLKSQGLVFDRCDVSVEGATASARCRGRIQYVRKVGTPVPRVASQQWLFKMRKVGAEWKIEAVNAS